MTDQDNGGGSFLALLVGVALGAAAGLLLAPRSGKETRKRVQKWLDDAEERGSDVIQEGRDIFERGKKTVEEGAEKFRRFVDGD